MFQSREEQMKNNRVLLATWFRIILCPLSVLSPLNEKRQRMTNTAVVIVVFGSDKKGMS